MPSTNPANTSFGNLLVGFIIQANPFKVGEFTPELNNWPAHRDTRLGDDGPPMFFTLLLLLDAVVRTILTVINQIRTVFFRQEITTTLTQGLAMGRPEFTILGFDLFKCVIGTNGRQLGFLKIAEVV